MSWTSTNATSASIDNGVGSVTPVAGGSVSVSPTTTTTYTLTLMGPGGQITKQATVTVSSSFDQTIQITGTGPVNLRTLANNTGYSDSQNATITFQLGSAVTITGATGGGVGIDTGTWPSNKTISLTLQVSGKVYGGGGAGGTGAGENINGTNGSTGGDAISCQQNLTVVVNSGGQVKGGGGGGGGGGGWWRLITMEGIPTANWYNGGGGGGGFPNGSGGPDGPVGGGDTGHDVSQPGAAGPTSGGGAGGAGGAAGGGRVTGAGGTGGAAAATGPNGNSGTGTQNATNALTQNGAGGAAGYAVRKNGKTVTVTNNGTITGTVG
ncbi:MAG: hypothetical protein IT547_05495 [Hyphomonadaceae bacterium]|nr:hypothetical protein [Hyphomonadaceae bacterium]